MTDIAITFVGPDQRLAIAAAARAEAAAVSGAASAEAAEVSADAAAVSAVAAGTSAEDAVARSEAAAASAETAGTRAEAAAASAETAGTSAEDAVARSEAAAASAEAAALSATAAGAAAVSATTAAVLGGVMYPDTTTGLAAAAPNAYFVVVGDGTNTYATLYREESGVAVKKADLPSRSPFDLPAASGSDDSGMINAVIALAAAGGGGVVRARWGSAYQIADTILLRSRVTLDLGGSTILNVAEDAIRMISNPAMLDEGVSCTIEWSAGLEATVNHTAHGLVRGDYVWLRGAEQAQFRGVFRVVDVTSVDAYVVQLWRTPTTMATGTITVVQADTDIALVGADLDHDFPNTPIGIGYATIPTYFAGAANLRVERYRCINGQKMALTIAAVNGYVVDGLHCPHSGSDGLKIYGPAFGGQISNVFGFTLDDFVSVHPREYDVFAENYQISDGDVIGVRLSNLSGRTENGKMFTMYATDTGPIIEGVEVDGVHGGPSAASFGAVISAHCYAPEENGVIGSCVIRNVTACGPRVFDAINVTAARIDLRLAGCRPIDPAAQFVMIDSASIIGKLIISGYADDTGLTTARFIDLDGGRIDHCVIDNLQFAGPSYFLTNTRTGATLGRLDILSSDLGTTGATFLRFTNSFANPPVISVRNSVVKAFDFLECTEPLRLDVSETEVSIGQYFVHGLNPPTGTCTMRVSTRNVVKTGGGWLNGGSNIKFEIFSMDIREAVQTSYVARVEGAFLYNLSTIAGTITQTGIVDCHGTAANSWRVRGDPVAQRY